MVPILTISGSLSFIFCGCFIIQYKLYTIYDILESLSNKEDFLFKRVKLQVGTREQGSASGSGGPEPDRAASSGIRLEVIRTVGIGLGFSGQADFSPIFEIFFNVDLSPFIF